MRVRNNTYWHRLITTGKQGAIYALYPVGSALRVLTLRVTKDEYKWTWWVQTSGSVVWVTAPRSSCSLKQIKQYLEVLWLMKQTEAPQ